MNCAAKPGMYTCGRCYEDAPALFDETRCPDPRKLAGQPIGMFHCPDCGAMVVAGVVHPPLCQRCIDRVHPGFDEQRTAQVQK